MKSSRLEAFSDGVLAIIITIMVLELKAPHSADIDALRPLVPSLLTYLLSFIYIGIYWNNHHHLLHATPRVNGAIMWANLNLLFWLSLVPFFTAWLGENHSAPWPAALYGGVLLMAAISYTILQATIVAHLGSDSKLAQSLGSDLKGRLSILLYIAGIGLAWLHPTISDLLYIGVALMWVIPDRRARVAAEE
ncbi:MAG: DUF1211 domain-containing protein [bacterium]|nr:DUF1211 domain-containing protein [bacterium]